jgi:FixJ family two-component response regulator
MESGAARFLPKPFRVKDLLQTIEELLSSTPEQSSAE